MPGAPRPQIAVAHSGCCLRDDRLREGDAGIERVLDSCKVVRNPAYAIQRSSNT